MDIIVKKSGRELKKQMNTIIRDEKKFQEILENFQEQYLNNPVDVFIDVYTLESLNLVFKDRQDAVDRNYLLLNEIQKLLSDKTKEDQNRHIKYLVDIIKKKKIK